jgi:MFS transporter, CP family, cyanate transporter
MTDSKEVKITLYPFRWAILFAAFALHACLQFGILIVPGMAVLLMGEYGLSPVEFSMISTMPYLTGFLFGIVSGTWADRKGIRQVMLVGIIIAFVGAALRCVSTDFTLLLVSSFLMGFALAALNANSAKLLGMWFPGKNTSVAMGIYIAGATVGAATALAIGPSFSVASSGFIVAAIAVLVAAVIWFALGKTHPHGEQATADESIMVHLGQVVKSKNVWLISIFMFFLFGCTVTEQTFSNAAFAGLTGDVALAGAVSSVNTIAVGVGGIVMPMIVARMKSLKPIMIVFGILNGVLVGSILLIGFGPQTWILMVLQGALLGVLLPLGKTLPALLPDVKIKHMGAAGGLQSMLQNLGAWLIPAYVISPIVMAAFGGSNEAVFIGAGICTVICSLCIVLVPETGTSVEAKLEREALAEGAHKAKG